MILIKTLDDNFVIRSISLSEPIELNQFNECSSCFARKFEMKTKHLAYAFYFVDSSRILSEVKIR